jgi:hypothetical protein
LTSTCPHLFPADHFFPGPTVPPLAVLDSHHDYQHELSCFCSSHLSRCRQKVNTRFFRTLLYSSVWHQLPRHRMNNTRKQNNVALIIIQSMATRPYSSRLLFRIRLCRRSTGNALCHIVVSNFTPCVPLPKAKQAEQSQTATCLDAAEYIASAETQSAADTKCDNDRRVIRCCRDKMLTTRASRSEMQRIFPSRELPRSCEQSLMRSQTTECKSLRDMTSRKQMHHVSPSKTGHVVGRK